MIMKASLWMKSISFFMCFIIHVNGIFEVWNQNALQQKYDKNDVGSENLVKISKDVSDVYNSINQNINKISKDIFENIFKFKFSFEDFDTKKKPAYKRKDLIQNEYIFDNNVDPYVPDIDLNTLQFIVKYGYEGESHVVKTEDGYLLTMHRIPCVKTNNTRCQPVFLQHGLLASSSDFVITGPKKALAFILADAGYDVWMGNFRGNTYSRAHVNMSSHESDFWEFSWHEAAIHDLPAMIDYVNKYKLTKNDIIYIGHSMGTSTLFALLSTKPEYNERLKAAFTLAPVAYMKSLISPIRYLSTFANSIEWIAEHLGLNEFLPENFIIKWLAKDCEKNKFDQKLCENIIFVICGYDEAQLNGDILPVILGHTPAGASTRMIVHYAQEIRDNGNFQMFDYGSAKNFEVYGQNSPPQYNVTNISLPIAFFCADNDWLSATSDAQRLYNKLLHPVEFYKVPYKNFNHLDFLWGKDAPTLVYKRLMELMKKFH